MKKHIPKISVLLIIFLFIFVITPGGRRILSKAVSLPQLQTSQKENASHVQSNEAQSDETEAVHNLVEQIKERDNEQEQAFPLIQVIDDGAQLPANQTYTGLVCNIKDTSSEVRLIRQLDERITEEEVFTARLNVSA